MGGYGALIAAGAGVNPEAVVNDWVPGDKLAMLQTGNAEYEALLDDRIKAVVLFAPWGGHRGVWQKEDLKGLDIPAFFIVGDQDRTANYSGVRFLFENSLNADRYLLVYQNGIHEVAVNPPPPIAEEHFREFMHYQEPAWDNRRCNNINQHFVTAFLGLQLQGTTDYRSFLDLIPLSNNADSDDPDYWKGFQKWTAVGLELHHSAP